MLVDDTRQVDVGIDSLSLVKFAFHLLVLIFQLAMPIAEALPENL